MTDYFIDVTQIQYPYVTTKSLVFRDKGKLYHSRSAISPALSSRLDLSTRWKSPLHSVWCVILILFNRDCDCAHTMWLCRTICCPIYSPRSYKTGENNNLLLCTNIFLDWAVYIRKGVILMIADFYTFIGHAQYTVGLQPACYYGERLDITVFLQPEWMLKLNNITS